MPHVRVLDLDGSLDLQPDVIALAANNRVDARAWGPRIRLACSFGTFQRFERSLEGSVSSDEPFVTCYGSGDFHHVTLALLRRIRGPFNLLVLDKHPDWMRGIPFLHCGTWLRHALRLPNLGRVFHCGGLADFDNAYRTLAPWPEIRSGRVIAFPPHAAWARGAWAGIPSFPLGLDSTEAGMLEVVRPFQPELRRVPLYVSIDKDVLCADDASVNWDSGALRVKQVLDVLAAFLQAADGRLIGADLLGDWSPIRVGTWLNRLCDRIDHPSPAHDPAEAAQRNQRANLALLGALGIRPAADAG